MCLHRVQWEAYDTARGDRGDSPWLLPKIKKGGFCMLEGEARELGIHFSQHDDKRKRLKRLSSEKLLSLAEGRGLDLIDKTKDEVIEMLIPIPLKDLL